MPKIDITHNGSSEPEDIVTNSSLAPVEQNEATEEKESVNHILLVDDDRFITVAYKEGLEHAGHLVAVARDGIEAFEVLKTIKAKLIVLDLIMPRMNGFEFLQQIKLNNVLKTVPVLVLSNLNQQSDIEEAQSYGIVDFIVKADMALSDLVDRIDQIVK